MKSIRSIVAAFALAASGAVFAGSAPVLSDFSKGREGWITVDLREKTPWADVQWTLEDGFIASDDAHEWNAFSAPLKFLGDKGGFLGGTLSLKLSDNMRDDLPV